MVHANLGFDKYPNYLVKKFENQLYLILLRDKITKGDAVTRLRKAAPFQTVTSATATMGDTQIYVADSAGYNAGALGGGYVQLEGDPVFYQVVGVSQNGLNEVLELDPPLGQNHASGTIVEAHLDAVSAAGRLSDDVPGGYTIITLDDLSDFDVGMTFKVDHDADVYTIRSVDPVSRQVRFTPSLRLTYPTGALVYSFDSPSFSTNLLVDADYPSDEVYVNDVSKLRVDDYIKIGPTDEIAYKIEAIVGKKLTLDSPLGVEHFGPKPPYVVKEYHLYTPMGTAIRSSALQMGIEGDIVSVAYDASSKLQYFLMTYLKEGVRKYYIIRGDFISQVFHFETRSLDLDNLSGNPVDFAIYQNGVFILCDTQIAHFYSLKGTHRQKIEFNNLKKNLTSIDYFADFISTYNHYGEIYPGATVESTSDVTQLSDIVADFPKGLGVSSSGLLKIGQFATMEISTEDPEGLPWVQAINDANPPGQNGFPFPIYHQFPLAKIMEGPLKGTESDPKYMHDYTFREFLISDGIMNPKEDYMMEDPLNPGQLIPHPDLWASRNEFNAATGAEWYVDKQQFHSKVVDWKAAYDGFVTGYKNNVLLSGSDINFVQGTPESETDLPVQKTYGRWLMLYDDGGYVFVWDLILNKIIKVSRTGMHYHTGRTACNLGVEKHFKTKPEILAQLRPYFDMSTVETTDGLYAKMVGAGVGELDISAVLTVSHKTFDEWLDAYLDSPPVLGYDTLLGGFTARVGVGINAEWKRKVRIEGVKTEGIDLQKSPFLSLHDYGSLATSLTPGVPKVVLEHDTFDPVIGSSPNGIALVAHEMRNENPQFTFTVKLWGDVGETIGRQRVYCDLAIYNNTTIDPQLPAYKPDPIFVFTDDRGLATGTFPMPEIPVEGHMILKFSVQALSQPDKADLYIFDTTPSVVEPGEDVKIQVWGYTAGDPVEFSLDGGAYAPGVLVDEELLCHRITVPSNQPDGTLKIRARSDGKLSNDVMIIVRERRI
jgi:hypothetical protein